MGAASSSEDIRVRGRLSVNRRGFGFVTVEEPVGHEDVFVPARQMGGALSGDLVEVELRRRPYPHRREKGPRGAVVRVLQRSTAPVIGRVVSGDPAYLVSDNPRHPDPMRIASDQNPPHGAVVAARIEAGLPLRVRVVDVLGREDDPELVYRVACARHAVPGRFSDEVEAEASSCRGWSEQDLAGRRDLRDQVIFTIDGADARDFDDAVSIDARSDGGWRLGVHIADVAHYVRAGRALDDEALARGTSVYFPDRAVPMLPERLSNDLCSLRPDTDRLAVSVEMEFDSDGSVAGVEFFDSVIHSRARMTYERVDALTAGGEAPEGSEAVVVEPLNRMLELAAVLRRNRLERGAIDLDVPEAEAVFDTDGEIVSFRRRPRLPSHQLIEEFMLAANEAVAGRLSDSGAEMIFRVHPRPDEERLLAFQSVAAHFGLFFGGPATGRLKGADFQAFLEQLRKQPELDFLAALLLRSFERAFYSDDNIGHFGLGADCYTHFTSPIRRYPDLATHRLLKQLLAGGGNAAPQPPMATVARQSSERERAAADAEREVMRVLMARWMAGRLGHEFSGVITAVGRWGFEVRIPQFLIEGSVSRDALPERMRFFPDRMRLAGRQRSFQIGDRVNVLVARVETDTGRIEFEVK